jgi:hypothetical protein
MAGESVVKGEEIQSVKYGEKYDVLSHRVICILVKDYTLSPEERRTAHKEYMRQWRLNNPKTPEEIAEREKAKQKRKEERKQKIKESSKERERRKRQDPLYRRAHKIFSLKWRYGLTETEIEDLNRVNECPVCKLPFSATILQDKTLNGKTPCIDHNHVTGKVRGVLCDKCNRFMGFAEQHLENVLLWLQRV